MQNEFLNILQMKRRHCAPLSEPQVKRRPGHDLGVTGSPLPVPVASLTGVPASNSLWAVYYGSLVTLEAGRHRVEVSDPGQARAPVPRGQGSHHRHPGVRPPRHRLQRHQEDHVSVPGEARYETVL